MFTPVWRTSPIVKPNARGHEQQKLAGLTTNRSLLRQVNAIGSAVTSGGVLLLLVDADTDG
jgi:hypothetical protein